MKETKYLKIFVNSNLGYFKWYLFLKEMRERGLNREYQIIFMVAGLFILRQLDCVIFMYVFLRL